MQTTNEAWEVFMRSGTELDGRLWVGVKTTGIFCKPSCRARKPKRENTEFYPSPQQAILAGLRPCKLCFPLELSEPMPQVFKALVDEIDAEPLRRISEADLRARKLSPDSVRRWSLKFLGLTFQSYQRARRLNLALGGIRKGNTVTETAFDAGFESLSGFSAAFSRQFGTQPGAARNLEPIRTRRIDTELGQMTAAVYRERLCLLEFSERRALENELLDLQRIYHAPVLPGESEVFLQLQSELGAYFSGTLRRFSVPLDFPGTGFQKSVWEALLEIPYGETRSYAQQARAIGRPEAVRAVARANGANRLAILVPCHRVIGSDGSLTGYAGGLARKERLLKLENSARL